MELKEVKSAIEAHLYKHILPYWEKYARDPVNKGFYGKIDSNNKQYGDESRSIVMTARFLWSFSAAARISKNSAYLEMADYAYDVICNQFWDRENEGVYWSVTFDGKPCVTKKQVYGEAFCCYGLAEYAAAVSELRNDSEASKNALSKAVKLFELMDRFALDKELGGYVEARAVNWDITDDWILSPVDMNCPKSMNTNLHVMEAWTTLLRQLKIFAPNDEITALVRDSLKNLIVVTVERIFQKDNHLALFFDMEWNRLDFEISYGHDIEASWLLWEALEVLGDKKLSKKYRQLVIDVAHTALIEGFDQKNGCMENKLDGEKRDRTRVWWNQAESLVGFFNAYELTGSAVFLTACHKEWSWIIEHQMDKTGGDWWNEIDAEGNPIMSADKGGNWKTSYHNGRACMELISRLK